MRKLIKYIFFLIITLLFFTSCEKIIHTKDELIINLDNRLEKSFVCCFETNICEKQILLGNHESDSLIFVNEQMVETGIFRLSELEYEQMVILLETALYNISDTTYFKWTEIRDKENEKEIYYEHLNTTHKEHSHLNSTSYRNITIDSTLLPIFKKDYTMLEQFKEYYESDNDK